MKKSNYAHGHFYFYFDDISHFSVLYCLQRHLHPLILLRLIGQCFTMTLLIQVTQPAHQLQLTQLYYGNIRPTAQLALRLQSLMAASILVLTAESLTASTHQTDPKYGISQSQLQAEGFRVQVQQLVLQWRLLTVTSTLDVTTTTCIA